MYRYLRRFSVYNSNWQIGTVTAVFLIVAAILSALVSHAIFEMQRSADAMDDVRARKAAEVAVLSMGQNLAATVRDNAVWDDAFVAMDGTDAADWAFENWGKTSEDYELYDGAIVTARDGTVISAHWEGVPFDPFLKLKAEFSEQIRQANRVGADPVLSFQRVDDALLLVGSLALQPYADPVEAEAFNILTFFKILSPDVVDRVAEEYQLRDLSLDLTLPAADMLAFPIKNIAGQAIAHLQWPREMPGTKVYRQVSAYLTAGLVLFVLFLIGILVAGNVEAARLRRIAACEKWNATHDRLSGLLNRAGLLDVLKVCAKTPNGAQSLQLLDLDGFKQVNDAWGHAVGDELIMLVSKRLLSISPQGATVARLGGDEFAVLHHGDNAMAFSEHVIAEMAKPFDIGGRTIEIGASIGFAFFERGVEPLELLRRADMSLYRAKESGRGRAVEYFKALDEERDRLSSLEGQLRAAISAGSIRPVFQPLVSASSGRICGVEALARWQTPAGSVSPEVFIPLAERAGLIDALGMHMLEQAVKTAQVWPGLDLSVNVSPIQLCNPSFPSQITDLLQREKFDPKRLTLEITESVLMSNPEMSRRAMDTLRKLGVKFALDDFGCGYASIGALRQFGFERMKIDRSLVWASDDEGQGSGVLEATIALAVALEIPVTAEGVETSRQAQLLRSAGCQQLQGFLIGKPMSSAELEMMMKAPEAVA
ncbi:bifunctional diguanylate cyclase/phosphodiesterase (plasmid) [Rhizobium rosettiformans]|uniref:Bifunctional diguanylate cyclase/phosphodiesterase n=1 Tax=Rhizobium rosettiformans TaxID=1368430 RepID=A0ABX7F538_9HYPH|nr:bifunctional diguanylate cyclase/phosphodiesterase [Rhizobium rosettiformans]QRF54486.1 bifunctional diguanylate cyclase/phosphodiesterase [Rhizobium rosettiformans]